MHVPKIWGKARDLSRALSAINELEILTQR